MPPAPADAFITSRAKASPTYTWSSSKIGSASPAARRPQSDRRAGVHRKTAEQTLQSLYTQLGLSESDFYNASTNNPLAGDSYAVRRPRCGARSPT